MAKRSTPARVNVPQTDDEVAGVITSLAQLLTQKEAAAASTTRRLEPLTSVLWAVEQQIAEVTADGAATLADLNEAIAAHLAKLYGSQKSGFDHPDGRRTIKLPLASLSVRKRPKRIKIASPKDVLDRLVDLGLSQFYRTKYTINRQAMRDDPDKATAVEGVELVQDEDFRVELQGGRVVTYPVAELSLRLPRK